MLLEPLRRIDGVAYNCECHTIFRADTTNHSQARLKADTQPSPSIATGLSAIVLVVHGGCNVQRGPSRLNCMIRGVSSQLERQNAVTEKLVDAAADRFHGLCDERKVLIQEGRHGGCRQVSPPSP